MKTFKQHLSEMNYGSLVSQDKLDSLNPDEQELYKYTADGFSFLSNEQIKRLAKKYPYEGGTLYRGLHFDTPEAEERWLKNFNEGGKTHLDGMSSWTPHLGTAVGFARTVKTYFPTKEVMLAHAEMTKSGDRMTGHGGVVLKVTVPSGIGLDVNKTDYAKESEVILPGGDYEISIERTMNPLRREITDADVAKAHVAKLVAMHKNVKDKKGEIDAEELKILKQDRDELSNYLHASWAEHLAPEDCDKLFMVSLGRHLEHIEKSPEDSVKVTKEKTFIAKDEYEISIWCGALLPDSSPIIARLTDKLKKRIHRANIKVARALETELNKIDSVQDVIRLSVQGDVTGLSAALGHDIGRQLRAKFAAEYHRLNSREHTKMLDLSDRRAMEKYTKRITTMVQALGAL